MHWSEEWELAFNSDKCSVLQLGRNNTSNKYTFESDKSIELKNATKERDLASTEIDSQLAFGEHIIQMVGKANRHLGLN